MECLYHLYDAIPIVFIPTSMSEYLSHPDPVLFYLVEKKLPDDPSAIADSQSSALLSKRSVSLKLANYS